MRNFLILGVVFLLFGLWLFFGVQDAGPVGLLMIISSVVMLGLSVWNPQSKDRSRRGCSISKRAKGSQLAHHVFL